MTTPSRENLIKLADYWYKHQEYIRYNHKILNIYQGQLKPYLEKAIREDYTDETQIVEIIQRAPTLNILRSVVDKLAKVYANPVGRVATDNNQEMLDDLVESLDLDSIMATADEMFTLHKACFLEPFVDEGRMQLRVVPMDRALPYSDNPVNPLRPTAVMKLVGREKPTKTGSAFTDQHGQITDLNGNQEEDVLLVYTDNYIFLMYSKSGALPAERLLDFGGTPDQLVEIDGTPALINPLGKIPMVYLNRSKFSIVPPPDNDLYDMTLLLPKLLADLNYAVKYQASSVIISQDLEIPQGAKKRANSIIEVKTLENAPTAGKLDVLKPQVDITPVLSLIQGQLIMWLESRGLKSGSAGKASEQRASGLAKIIDSADASAERFNKINFYTPMEKRLFELLRDFQNTAIANRDVDTAKVFRDDFELLRIEYPDQRPLQSSEERFTQAQMLIDNELATKKQILRLLFPSWSDKVIAQWLDDLDNDQGEFLNVLSRQISQSNRRDFQTSNGQESLEQGGESSDQFNQETNS